MAKKEIVFNEDGTLNEKSNRIVTDDEGYKGCWCTDKRKGKYFIRVGETAKSAWKRRQDYLLAQPVNKSKNELILFEKDGFIMSNAEYKVLDSAIFQKLNNRQYIVKPIDCASTSEHFYLFEPSDNTNGYRLIRQLDNVKDDKIIKKWRKRYDEY